MTRPRIKNELEKKTHILSLRLDSIQMEYAKQTAAQSGMTVASWFRACAFRDKRPKLKPSLINKELFNELNRVGVNINQLTHNVNKGNSNLFTLSNELGRLHEVLTSIQQILLEK